jgi:hypothetical protein
MMNDPKLLLAKTFQNYLHSGMDKDAAKEICRVLDHSGLHNESKALEAYLEAQNISRRPSGELDWDQRKCYSGPHPPSNPNANDVWFDVVELAPMILIPREDEPSLDHACWLAMHPVYRWQFDGFLRCIKVRRKRIEFPSALDYLSADRFDDLDPTTFVNDVYHDEALAYAHWFGKFLSGQFELEDAQHFLGDNEFSVVLPPRMRLWDESEFADSEFIRLAVGSDTLYKDPDDHYNEFLLRESGDNKKLPSRMLYEEWERREDIGFSTSVPLELGLIDDLPRDSIFFEFRNAAPR